MASQKPCTYHEGMALGEDLLLLAIPSRGGHVRAVDRLGFALHASVVVDLALAGRVKITARRIDVVDPAPLDDRRLNNALISLRDDASATSLGDWVRRTPRGHATVTMYLSALADQGAVRFERRHERIQSPPRAELLAPERRAAVLVRLNRVARGRPASDADRALAGLVHACGLDRHLYHAPFGLRARRRLTRFEQADVADGAQAVLAAHDAELSQAVAEAISDGLQEMSRELIKLVRYEHHLQQMTGGHRHDSAPGHHGGIDTSGGHHHH